MAKKSKLVEAYVEHGDTLKINVFANNTGWRARDFILEFKENEVTVLTELNEKLISIDYVALFDI